MMQPGHESASVPLAERCGAQHALTTATTPRNGVMLVLRQSCRAAARSGPVRSAVGLTFFRATTTCQPQKPALVNRASRIDHAAMQSEPPTIASRSRTNSRSCSDSPKTVYEWYDKRRDPSGRIKITVTTHRVHRGSRSNSACAASSVNNRSQDTNRGRQVI
jgi:hypothetical protein